MANVSKGVLTACFRIVIQDKAGRPISNDTIRHYLRNDELLIEQYGEAELFRTISLGTGIDDDSVLLPTVTNKFQTLDVTISDPLNNRRNIRSIKTAKGTDIQFEYVETVFGLSRETPLQLTELSIDGIGRVLLRDQENNPKTYTLNYDESMTIYCDIRHSLITPDTPLSLRFWDEKTQEAIPYDVFVRHIPTTQWPSGLGGAVDNLVIQVLENQDLNLHPNTLMNKAATDVSSSIHKQGIGYVEKRLSYQPTSETMLSGIVMYQKAVGAMFFLMLSEPIHFNPGEKRDFFLLYEWGGKAGSGSTDPVDPEPPIDPEIPGEPEIPTDKPAYTRVFFVGTFSGYASQGGFIEIVSSKGERKYTSLVDGGFELLVVSPYVGLDYVDITSEGSLITIGPHIDDTGGDGVSHIVPGTLPIPIQIIRTQQTMMASRMVSLPMDREMTPSTLSVSSGDNLYLMGNNLVGATDTGEGEIEINYGGLITHTVPILALPQPTFTISTADKVTAGGTFSITANYDDPSLAQHFGEVSVELEHDSLITDLGGNQFKSSLLLSGEHSYKVLVKSENFDTVVSELVIDFTPVVLDFPSIDSMYVGELAKLAVNLPDNIDHGMTLVVSGDPSKCDVRSLGSGTFQLEAKEAGLVEIKIQVFESGYSGGVTHTFNVDVKPELQPRIRMEPTIRREDGEVTLSISGVNLDEVGSWWIESNDVRLAHLDGLILYPHGYGAVELFLHLETQWGRYTDNFLLEIV